MPENENTQQDDQTTVTPVAGDVQVASDGGVADGAQAVGDENTDDAAKQETVTQTEAPIVDAVEMNKTQKIIDVVDNAEAVSEIAAKINEVENILVALSNDPSVDEIAAAIGLTLALEKIGKHATAIYSGATPDVLEFLEPENTLEDNADSLQDLIIALNKEKADHLQYKIDGDYVKIFVTPYKTKLTEDDFSYSYGNYNVDLVIALNVRSAIKLDAVLREHGRIMHDASAIDITIEAPGQFGEIEWSNPTMSSVSEMVTTLLIGMKKPELDSEVATPLLAGIVSATERFKNEKTSPDTMKVAGRLMEAGANVQAVTENVLPGGEEEGQAPDTVKLEVNHDEEPQEEAEPVEEVPSMPEPVVVEPERSVDAPLLNDELMEELRRQQEEANKPPVEEEPVPDENVKDYGKMIDEALAELNNATPAEPVMETATPAEAGAGVPEMPVENTAAVQDNEPEAASHSGVVIEPESDLSAVSGEQATGLPEENEAGVNLPEGSEAGTDLPLPGSGVLPPAPTPEINFDTEMPVMPEPVVTAMPEPVTAAAMPESVVPEVAPQTEVGAESPVEPAAQPETTQPAEQPVVAQPADPSEFRIPGM